MNSTNGSNQMERTVTVVEAVTEAQDGPFPTEGGTVCWEVFLNGYPFCAGMTLEIALHNLVTLGGYLLEGGAA